jgi:hypothetical protein
MERFEELPTKYLEQLNRSINQSDETGEFEEMRCTIVDELGKRAIESINQVSRVSISLLLDRGEE